MCKLFIDNEIAIKEYCVKNDLNFEKVKHSPKSYNDIDVYVQHYEMSGSGMGLLDETPCPVTLKIFKTDNGLLFEQTEYTNQYLSLSGEINKKSAAV